MREQHLVEETSPRRVEALASHRPGKPRRQIGGLQFFSKVTDRRFFEELRTELPADSFPGSPETGIPDGSNRRPFP